MGHSMGGHGALTLGLRNPQLYKSISAFSPICNPIQVPWGQKAFSGYLGDNQEEWKQYDATELVYSDLPKISFPELLLLVLQIQDCDCRSCLQSVLCGWQKSSSVVPTSSFCLRQVQSYSGPPRSILIDVGTADDFLEKQLKPENFAKAAAAHGGSSIKLQLRMQVCACIAVLSVEARKLGL